MVNIERVYLKMIEYFKDDVKRINHAIKVFSFARFMGRMEGLNLTKQTILEIASILHDIGIKVCEEKYNSTAGHYQEIEGPIVAKDILADMEIDEKILERVLFLIGSHHSYHKVDDIDFQILIEADFIVNIFEDGLEKDAISSIKEKYFRTKTGIKLIESMYRV